MLMRGKRAIIAAAECVMQTLERRELLSSVIKGGVWKIRADSDEGAAIVVQVSPKDSGKLQLWIDGKKIDEVKEGRIHGIEIHGGSGDDSIVSKLGRKDVGVNLYGGRGMDTLIGGSGHDAPHGQSGDDSLVGGNGDELLYGR